METVTDLLASLLRSTQYTTWRPTWRLHLAHAFLAAIITLFSITAAWPLHTSMFSFEIVGGLALALCSRFPWFGALLGRHHRVGQIAHHGVMQLGDHQQALALHALPVGV